MTEIIASLLAVLASLIGYILWRKKQVNPRTLLNMEIEKKIEERKAQNAYEAHFSDIDRRGRLKRLLREVQDTTPARTRNDPDK